MTIVRVGLAETKNYGDGWNSVFGKSKPTKARRKAASGAKKKPARRTKKKK